MSTGERVLVIGGTSAEYDIVRLALDRHGFEGVHAVDPDLMEASFEECVPSVLVLDANLEMASSVWVLAGIRERFDDETLPVIVMIDEPVDMALYGKLERHGVVDFVVRPVDQESLLYCLGMALGGRRARARRQAVSPQVPKAPRMPSDIPVPVNTDAVERGGAAFPNDGTIPPPPPLDDGEFGGPPDIDSTPSADWSDSGEFDVPSGEWDAANERPSYTPLSWAPSGMDPNEHLAQAQRYFERGSEAMAQRRYRDAKNLFKKATALDHKDHYIAAEQSARGYIASEDGELERAAKHFRRALRLHLDNPYARKGLRALEETANKRGLGRFFKR